MSSRSKPLLLQLLLLLLVLVHQTNHCKHTATPTAVKADSTKQGTQAKIKTWAKSRSTSTERMTNTAAYIRHALTVWASTVPPSTFFRLLTSRGLQHLLLWQVSEHPVQSAVLELAWPCSVPEIHCCYQYSADKAQRNQTFFLLSTSSHRTARLMPTQHPKRSAVKYHGIVSRFYWGLSVQTHNLLITTTVPVHIILQD